ncbi:MAG: preprotein translocase subunit SecY [Alphaproteobacteria bacterium]|jgi:preprotein translocase subunit SecY
MGNFITVPFMLNDGSVSDFLSTVTKTGVLNQQALQRLSLFTLGIIPYITAGIIVQLLKFILSDTNYANDLKNKKFVSSQTLLFTLIIAIIQSFMFAKYSTDVDTSYIEFSAIIVFLVAGSFIMVWFAKIITTFGFGNGASILIMLSIIEHLYLSASDLFYGVQTGEVSPIGFSGHCIFILGLLFVICLIELSFRPLKLSYPSTKFRDGYNKGKKSDILPLKINNSGVLPLIFAMSFSALLSTSLAPYIFDKFGYDISILLTLVTLAFVVFFVAFYTPFVMNTEEMSNNLKKSNIILENNRPGLTTKKYLDVVINKLNYIAVLYLGLMVLAPDLLRYNGFNVIVSGVSAVILVVVVIDIVRRIQYMSYSHNTNSVMN